MKLTKEILIEALKSDDVEISSAAARKTAYELFCEKPIIKIDDLPEYAPKKRVFDEIGNMLEKNVNHSPTFATFFKIVKATKKISPFAEIMSMAMKIEDDFVREHCYEELSAFPFSEKEEGDRIAVLIENYDFVGFFSKLAYERAMLCDVKTLERGRYLDCGLSYHSFEKIAEDKYLLKLWKKMIAESFDFSSNREFEKVLLYLDVQPKKFKRLFDQELVTIARKAFGYKHSDDKNQFLRKFNDLGGNLLPSTFLKISKTVLEHKVESYELSSILHKFVIIVKQNTVCAEYVLSLLRMAEPSEAVFVSSLQIASILHNRKRDERLIVEYLALASSVLQKPAVNIPNQWFAHAMQLLLNLRGSVSEFGLNRVALLLLERDWHLFMLEALKKKEFLPYLRKMKIRPENKNNFLERLKYIKPAEELFKLILPQLQDALEQALENQRREFSKTPWAIYPELSRLFSFKEYNEKKQQILELLRV